MCVVMVFGGIMPERTFTIFHLNLSAIRQLDIETVLLDRDDWIRNTLSEGFEFPHWGGGSLYWVPQGNIDECILGLIERERSHEHHKSPAEGGEEVQTKEWQGAYVLIDPTYHDEGQRIAIENDIVGQPQALLKSLVAEINERKSRPFNIDVEPLFDGKDFWAYAQKHGNILKTITFDFVVPNMWGTESDLEKDLEETKEETGAQRVKVSFKSNDGVTTDNQKVRDGVDYAEKGAGDITARSMDGDTYQSSDRPKSTSVPLVSGKKDQMIEFFAKLKDRVLGRE